VRPKISEKKLILIFSIYDLDPEEYGLDLTGFRGFWPRATFLSKKFINIRESIFGVFRVFLLFSFFRGISVIYRHIKVLIYMQKEKSTRRFPVRSYSRVFSSFFDLRTFHSKNRFMYIVKQILIMLKLLKIGYFVKYLTDGIA